jgi:hypothetical protein
MIIGGIVLAMGSGMHKESAPDSLAKENSSNIKSRGPTLDPSPFAGHARPDGYVPPTGFITMTNGEVDDWMAKATKMDKQMDACLDRHGSWKPGCDWTTK